MDIDKKKPNFLEGLVLKSRKAQEKLIYLSNTEINNIILTISKEALKPANNTFLSKLAVEETSFGNQKDKTKKNFYKTNNLLNELLKVVTLQPINNKTKNIITILKPIGVICGVTPSTNPIATSLNYILNSIKCRNSIILCPNLRSYRTVNELVNLIKKILKKNKKPVDLVSLCPREISRSDLIINLFNLCDKNIVTGNQVMINRVKKSIKPYLVFGKGNAPIIIDQNINIQKTVMSIIESKSFDHSTSCSADSVLIIHRKIYNNFIKEFSKSGAYILNKDEKKKLDAIYFKKGIINTEIIGKNATQILKLINIQNNEKKIIAYSLDINQKNHFILGEKITPILAIVESLNLDTSIKFANSVLKIAGKGHSAGIYSKNKKNILDCATMLPVSRIIVNQPHSKSAGGSENNFLNTTLSLGCGPWGENNLSDNLSYKEFCNESKVVFKKKRTFKNLFTYENVNKVNNSKKQKDIIKIVKNILNEKINLNSNQANCKNWDSMSYFSILSSLEKEFKIKISQKNFNKFDSIKNILKIVK